MLQQHRGQQGNVFKLCSTHCKHHSTKQAQSAHLWLQGLQQSSAKAGQHSKKRSKQARGAPPAACTTCVLKRLQDVHNSKGKCVAGSATVMISGEDELIIRMPALLLQMNDYIMQTAMAATPKHPQCNCCLCFQQCSTQDNQDTTSQLQVSQRSIPLPPSPKPAAAAACSPLW
jgi:hypothetical protein